MKKPGKGFRKIVVKGKTWYWKYGSHVVAKSEDGEKKVIDLDKLSGLSWSDIERGEWKGWFCVTPADIEKWLKGDILKFGLVVSNGKKVKEH